MTDETISAVQVEAAAKALVPFAYGAFEWQRHSDGSRVRPPLQPNDHAKRAARAALTAAARVKASDANPK